MKKREKARQITRKISRRVKEKYFDCWSPAERKIKNFFERKKKILFYPFLRFFVWLGISANAISYVSAFLGVGAAVYMKYDLVVAGWLLLASFVLDGIDGSLARYTGKNDHRGALTDTFTDQVSVSATTIGLLVNGLIDIFWGSLYLVLYPVLILFSVLKNTLNIPNKYVFRPRVIVYCLFWWSVWIGENYLTLALVPIVIILFVYVLYDFYTLRKWAHGFGYTFHVAVKKRRKK
ncbi:CDP-alcohol phosphatidyltransferase family protein [Candidatus Gracilibacteria bacterium]|nr:CDP-alcohol phosphatidyltransferase family protein [Candidatus Gracilibacteria bacterium]MCF7819737.1 CDP-alcohol phosphatidyltransferase family protein [Candidatus Gracilibacteria bacterium]